MNRFALACAAVSTLVVAPVAVAATGHYNVTTTWYEPETQPSDSIFVGSFDFDPVTRTLTNLKGRLSESMTGGAVGYPGDSMTWLDLNYQLATWHDDTLGGTFAAAFRNSTTSTFTTSFGGDGWSPGEVVYDGWPNAGANPGNAYALIFVPDSPLTALTQGQIDKLAYADCAPGGMMGATCMTGTSEAGYGLLGSMGGYPVSQTITAAVPEPETYAMLMAGLGLVGVMARRRRGN